MRWAWNAVPWTVLVVALVIWRDDRQQTREREASLRGQITLWQARVAEAETARRVDSVEVVRTVTQTRTLRDTLNVHDTLQVIAYVYRTDTLRVACERCVASAALLSAANAGLLRTKDSLVLLLERQRPSRWDRIKPYAFLGAGFYVGAKVRVR